MIFGRLEIPAAQMNIEEPGGQFRKGGLIWTPSRTCGHAPLERLIVKTLHVGRVEKPVRAQR